MFLELRTFVACCGRCQRRSRPFSLVIPQDKKPAEDRLPAGWGIERWMHESYGMSSTRTRHLCPPCVDQVSADDPLAKIEIPVPDAISRLADLSEG